MINKSLIFSINLYQKYLSPYKGYHDDISYSQFAKNSIEHIVDKEALVDIRKDTVRALDEVSDPFQKDEDGNRSEYAGSLKASAKYSKKHLGRILSSLARQIV